jgi:hypothetical protein
MAPPVHVHAAGYSLGNKAGALDAAIPSAVCQLPARLAVVEASRHVGVADPLLADRENLLGFLESTRMRRVSWR